MQKEIQDALTNFRDNWQKELQNPVKNKNQVPNKGISCESKENEIFEQDARKLFLKGIDMERAGKLYEAIQFYRRAVQIVPDIEFKIDNSAKSKIRDMEGFEESDNGMYYL